MVLNHLASWIKLIRSPVKSSTSELIAPFVATNCKIIPATTTIEKKCGKYEAVCTSLLNFFDFSSFNKSAKIRSEEHTSELQSRGHLVCRLPLEKKNK